MLIQVGSAETLLDDAVRLSRAAGAAGVRVNLEVWPDMIHAFPLFYQQLAAGCRLAICKRLYPIQPGVRARPQCERSSQDRAAPASLPSLLSGVDLCRELIRVQALLGRPRSTLSTCLGP
jgi:acetyl esterase/lipase